MISPGISSTVDRGKPGEQPTPESPAPGPIVVKRYARSRLYDTANCCYLSMEQLRGWAAKGVAFAVIDTETGADITRVLLA
jgi:polyhydroxyalkanoate synthesis regulator protein